MEPKRQHIKLTVILLCLAAIGGWYITSGIAEDNTNTNTNINTATATINQLPNESMQVSPIVHLGGYDVTTTLSRQRTEEIVSENYRLLVSIDKRIGNINARLARIEKALNLKPVKSATVHDQKKSLRYGTD